jgi:hypothetical protein
MINKKKHTAYAIGKYAEAYYSLATEPGKIQNRLIVAAYKISPIDPDMVPDEVSPDVKWICDQFHSKDTLEKSIRGRHPLTCVNIAKRIIYVFCKLKQLNCTDRIPTNQPTEDVNIEINF